MSRRIFGCISSFASDACRTSVWRPKLKRNWNTSITRCCSSQRESSVNKDFSEEATRVNFPKYPPALSVSHVFDGMSGIWSSGILAKNQSLFQSICTTFMLFMLQELCPAFNRDEFKKGAEIALERVLLLSFNKDFEALKSITSPSCFESIEKFCEIAASQGYKYEIEGSNVCDIVDSKISNLQLHGSVFHYAFRNMDLREDSYRKATGDRIPGGVVATVRCKLKDLGTYYDADGNRLPENLNENIVDITLCGTLRLSAPELPPDEPIVGGNFGFNFEKLLEQELEPEEFCTVDAREDDDRAAGFGSWIGGFRSGEDSKIQDFNWVVVSIDSVTGSNV